MIFWEDTETYIFLSEQTGVSPEEALAALEKANAKYSWIDDIEAEDYDNFNLIYDEALRILGK